MMILATGYRHIARSPVTTVLGLVALGFFLKLLTMDPWAPTTWCVLIVGLMGLFAADKRLKKTHEKTEITAIGFPIPTQDEAMVSEYDCRKKRK